MWLLVKCVGEVGKIGWVNTNRLRDRQTNACTACPTFFRLMVARRGWGRVSQASLRGLGHYHDLVVGGGGVWRGLTTCQSLLEVTPRHG